MIDKSNIKTELIRYFEGEMSASEAKAFEQLLNEDPDLQEELSNLEKTKLKPESGIRFPYKSQLKKQEVSTFPLFSTYTRVAAVVIMGLLVLLTSVLLFNNESNKDLGYNPVYSPSNSIVGGHFSIAPANATNQLQKIEKAGLKALSIQSRNSYEAQLKGAQQKIDQNLEPNYQSLSGMSIGQVEPVVFELSPTVEEQVQLAEIAIDSISTSDMKLPQHDKDDSKQGFFDALVASISTNSNDKDERAISIRLEGNNFAINGKLKF